MKLWSFDN